MAGRRAKPIDLHLIDGNKRHLTLAEISERQRSEAGSRSGKKRLTMSAAVESRPVAAAMFGKLRKLYAKVSAVETLDENVINRYCLMHAEAEELEGAMADIQLRIHALEDETDAVSELAALYNMLGNVSRALNGKREMLLKLEDRLFMNPVARVRNVPKAEPVKKADGNAELFG